MLGLKWDLMGNPNTAQTLDLSIRQVTAKEKIKSVELEFLFVFSVTSVTGCDLMCTLLLTSPSVFSRVRM